MAALWSSHELSMLSNLSDGITLDQIMQFIPNRSAGAVIQQALKRNYRIETSKVDGIARFYQGVTRRRGGRRMAATNNLQVAVEVPTIQVEPPRIIVNTGLQANNLAIRMLTENNLSADPDIIYQLSLHILKERS